MPIVPVQNGAQNEAGGSSTTIAATFGGNVTAGSLVIACCANGDDVAVSGFSDGANNGSQAAAKFAYLGTGYEIWCIENHPGGQATFTITFASACSFRSLIIAEFSGAATISPQEGSAAASGNSTTASSGNVSPTPSEDGALIVVHGRFNTDTPTWGSSFQTVPGIVRDGTQLEMMGYLVQGTAAAIAANWTQASGHWVAQAASFLPTAGASGAAAITGTAASGQSSKDLREVAGKTFIATLTGDTFIASFTDTDKLNILNGLVAAVTQTNGWNNQRSNIDHTTAVVRTSPTVATITLTALPGLHFDHDDILTWTIPGSVLTGGSPIVATPTVRIAKKEPDPFAKVVFRMT